jgi:hypothetical protein
MAASLVGHVSGDPSPRGYVENFIVRGKTFLRYNNAAGSLWRR